MTNLVVGDGVTWKLTGVGDGARDGPRNDGVMGELLSSAVSMASKIP